MCLFFVFNLVARTQGNLRLVLNTKLWPEMVLEEASERAIRVSAMEDGKIQLYLIMVSCCIKWFSDFFFTIFIIKRFSEENEARGRRALWERRNILVINYARTDQKMKISFLLYRQMYFTGNSYNLCHYIRERISHMSRLSFTTSFKLNQVNLRQ